MISNFVSFYNVLGKEISEEVIGRDGYEKFEEIVNEKLPTVLPPISLTGI